MIAIGLMNLFSPAIIHDFQSFVIWAFIFGILFAVPIAAQYSAFCEFTEVENMNALLR